MPKIVIGSTISASDPTAKETPFFSYFCPCGQVCMIADTTLDRLPRRRSDQSYILDTTKWQYKFLTKGEQAVALKREGGYERQHRQACIKCGLVINYSSPDPIEESRFIYVLPKSLTISADHHAGEARLMAQVARTATAGKA